MVWVLRKKAGIMTPDGDMGVPEEGGHWVDNGEHFPFFLGQEW